MTVQNLTKKEIKEKVNEGWIHAAVLFEIAGSPKAHIEKARDQFLENIDTDEQLITLSKDFEETIEVEGGIFSTAAECDYLILGMEKLTWLALNFMPASIEIKAPRELTFKEKDLTAWLNDLLAKLHEINAVHTNLKSHHDALVKNLNASIRNSVLLTLGDETLDAKAISKKVGLGEKQLNAFLEAMIKEDKLVKSGQKYTKK